MAKIKKINIKVGSETTSLDLGDLCSSDFQGIEDPGLTVRSIQAWAKKINRILKGISDESSTT